MDDEGGSPKVEAVGESNAMNDNIEPP